MNVTIKADVLKKEKIISFYKSFEVINNNEYAVFSANKNGTTIIVWNSKKENEFKITFSGENSLEEAKRFDESAKINEPKIKKEADHFLFLDDQIGSDEVGTGDFFGPITVVAALVRKTDLTHLKEVGVMDSKKMTDEYILSIAPKLLKKFPYSSLTLDNQKYNELVSKGYNMNQIKCLLHNKALFTLNSKHQDIKNVYIDEFTPKDNFYKYVHNEENIEENITFHIKGESMFPSVALASVFARYSFLKHMEEISKKYKVEIPFGASAKVTEFAKKFITNFGVDELNKIVKINFKNYKDL